MSEINSLIMHLAEGIVFIYFLMVLNYSDMYANNFDIISKLIQIQTYYIYSRQRILLNNYENSSIS